MWQRGDDSSGTWASIARGSPVQGTDVVGFPELMPSHQLPEPFAVSLCGPTSQCCPLVQRAPGPQAPQGQVCKQRPEDPWAGRDQAGSGPTCSRMSTSPIPRSAESRLSGQRQPLARTPPRCPPCPCGPEDLQPWRAGPGVRVQGCEGGCWLQRSRGGRLRAADLVPA